MSHPRVHFSCCCCQEADLEGVANPSPWKIVFGNVEFFVIVPWAHVPQVLAIGAVAEAAPESGIAPLIFQNLSETGKRSCTQR